MTIMVVTKLDKDTIHTTYINIESLKEAPYIMGVTLENPPWNPVGEPKIPDRIGKTEVTVK